MDSLSVIKEAIRCIAETVLIGKGLFVAGCVTETDGVTATVRLDDGPKVTGVRCMASPVESEGLIRIKPKVGSRVLLRDLSEGSLCDMAVAAFTEIECVDVPEIVLCVNGGGNGGLINIEGLTDRVNGLVRRVNDLIVAYNGHTHVVNTTGTAVAQTGTTMQVTSTVRTAESFDKGDYEDTNFRH